MRAGPASRHAVCSRLRKVVAVLTDLIATPDNPLTNIQTLKQVSFAMENGKVIQR